jgi:predicted GNAT family acetyltransferase
MIENMANDTPPQIADDKGARRYELTVGGKLAAHVAYRMQGSDTIDFVHTEVAPEFEGQGLGSRIAKFALDDARSRGLKVIPTCSYIANWLGKHPEYEDVVARH